MSHDQKQGPDRRTATRRPDWVPPLIVGCLVLLLAVGVGMYPAPAQAQGGPRCFAETGLCIAGRVREFWEQNGGLPVFGLPITPLHPETIEGQTVQVQWFERNRLELHPANPRPHDVLIGRVGADYLAQRLPEQQQTVPARHPDNTTDCRYFPETQQSVCGDMLAAWRAHGLELDGAPGTSEAESLALWGLPLTGVVDETLDDGNTYQVQWFERARFERHPHLAPPFNVQSGLLGRELRELRGNTATAATATTPPPQFTPTNTCPFHVPAGMTVHCGTLAVPEDRTLPDSRTIHLAVAIVPTQSANPAPDPVVYLSGGPGSPALVNTVTFARGWSWFLANRDFIVLDQRGTGFSQPSLLCPESSQLAGDLIGREVSRAEKVRLEVDTALQCRNRLTDAGVNVAGYTSAASAADLNDLRLALGYHQWNLFGISYGTRLALTAMRDYPEGIRSVVLDSTYPLQANLFTEMPANLNRSLRVLFDTCAADPSCNHIYPDLEGMFFALVDQLTAEPVTVWPRHPATGHAVAVRVDGAELLNLMFRTFYDTAALPLLPQMIADARQGNYDMLTRMQERRLGRSGGGFSHGAYFSVECSEEIAFATPDEVTASVAAFPRFQPFFAGIPENTLDIFRLCDSWGVHPPDPRENQPVYSAVPTLILAGEYDPITPPWWGYLAAETLSNSVVYEFPNTGHAVITRGACPQQMIRAFFDNPAQPPDGSCVGG